MQSKPSFMKNDFFIALSAFALVKPESLSYLGLGFLDTFLILFDFVLLLGLLINLRSYKVSKQTLLIVSMYLVLTLSTVVHGGNYSYLVKTVGPAFAMCLLTDYCMQKCPLTFMRVNTVLWSALYALNLLTILVFPNGMYTTDRLAGNCWLMGFDNGYTLVLIPLVGFSMIYSLIKRGKVMSVGSIFVVIILVLTELLTWSASGIIMTVILLVFISARNLPIIRKLIRPRLLIGIFYTATILIVFVRIIDIFAPIIVNVLDKDLTLTGRTYLWDYAINVVKDNWILGVGQGGFTVVGKFNSYLHPHCLLLDLLYKGGICMLFPFLWVIHRFADYTTELIEKPIAKIILMVTVCLLFGEIANSAQYKPFLWLFIVMSAYIPELCGVNNKRNELVKIRLI